LNLLEAGSVVAEINDDLRFLSGLGPRPCGSESLQRAFKYFYNKLKKYNPHKIKFQEFPVTAFQRGTCEITLSSLDCLSLEALSFGFCADNVTCGLEATYVDKGLPEDFERKAGEINGRLAVAQAVVGRHRSWVVKQAQKHNAAGLLLISNLPDGHVQTGYASQDNKRQRIFGAYISTSSGRVLKETIRAGRAFVDVEIENNYFRAVGRNLVASFGADSKPHVVLCAHLDRWDISSAISDNGSGVVTVIACAKLLARTGIPFRVVLFDGEEIGLKGSNDYVRRNNLSDIKAVINFYIIGFPDKVAFIGDVGSLPVSGLSAGSNDIHEIKLFLTTLDRIKYTSDYIPFTRRAIPVMLPISKLKHGRGRYYHSRHDTLENFNTEDIKLWPEIIYNLLLL
jgi:Zn-dependent M28 family amino/carboxypeptidase